MKQHKAMVLLAGGAMLAGVMLAGGCSPEHYSMNHNRYSLMSMDRYEFQSTPYLPTTVVLKEVHSGTVLWKYDIPAGSTLVADLDSKGDVEWVSISGKPATRLKWWVYGPSRGKPTNKGQMQLQGIPVILEVSHRPGPELPAGYVPPDAQGAGTAPMAPAAPQPSSKSPLGY